MSTAYLRQPKAFGPPFHGEPKALGEPARGLCVPAFDQEITITIKTKDGETINLEELILTIFETEQGKEIIRELIRNELIELIGGKDERH